MTATSCTSRTASVARPVSVLVIERCSTDCMAMAVEDMASARPTIDAGLPGEAEQHDEAGDDGRGADQLVRPRPSTLWRMRQSSAGCSSSPMRNSIMTMPNSATWWMVSVSETRPQPVGADQDAGGEIAEDGAEPGPLGERHQRDGRREEDEDREQEIAVHEIRSCRGCVVALSPVARRKLTSGRRRVVGRS